MKKALILMLYGVALTFVLKNYYKTESGLPTPTVIRNPTYLYGILALASDFLEGFPVVIAAGLTVALIWQIGNESKSQVQTQNSTQNTTQKVG